MQRINGLTQCSSSTEAGEAIPVHHPSLVTFLHLLGRDCMYSTSYECEQSHIDGASCIALHMNMNKVASTVQTARNTERKPWVKKMVSFVISSVWACRTFS